MSKKYKNRDKRMKDIRRYLDGDMTGRERNSFERKLQGDPFEEEAQEGLSKLSSSDLKNDMRLLDDRLKRRVHKRTPVYYRIAAAVVVLMAISSLFLVRELRKPEMMMSENVIELKDSIDEELVIPGAAAVDKAKKDISESATGKETRRSVVPEERPINKEIATLDDEIETDLKADQEKAEFQEVFNPEIKDSIARAKDQVTDEILREVMVAEALEEEAVEAKAYMVEEKNISATRTKKAGQVAAPVKAEEQADMEVRGVSVIEEEVVSEPVILTDRSARPFGGMKEFKIYLETDQIFPADWDVSDKEIIKLEISIGRKGQIKNIKINKSPGDQFSEEAIRLINEGPPWSAAIKNSMPVEDIVKLRIVFKK